MNRSTPGLPVHHQLLEFTQTHVHWVGDAIQPSHPLSSPFPPAPNPSQHQCLFQWVNSSQCPYKQQEIVSKGYSQGHSSHFLTQDLVFFFFPKKDCLTGFLFPPVALWKLFFFFLNFTNSLALEIVLTLSSQGIHASQEEIFRPDLDKTKWSLSGFLHSSG